MATAGAALALHYTALGTVFDFVALPSTVLLAMLALTVGYAAATQQAKRWFHRPRPGAPATGHHNVTLPVRGARARPARRRARA